jgi:hypothetical protein
MLPPFDESGNLPRGIHRASIEEVVDRFGHGSPEREVEACELFQFVEWARRHGVRRLIINGSFVTDKPDPNDVDVVLLPDGNERQQDVGFESEPQAWPFLQILFAADDADLERWARDDFGTDREGRDKGVVEVILWSRA